MSLFHPQRAESSLRGASTPLQGVETHLVHIECPLSDAIGAASVALEEIAGGPMGALLDGILGSTCEGLPRLSR